MGFVWYSSRSNQCVNPIPHYYRLITCSHNENLFCLNCVALLHVCKTCLWQKYSLSLICWNCWWENYTVFENGLKNSPNTHDGLMRSNFILLLAAFAFRTSVYWLKLTSHVLILDRLGVQTESWISIILDKVFSYLVCGLGKWCNRIVELRLCWALCKTCLYSRACQGLWYSLIPFS